MGPRLHRAAGAQSSVLSRLVWLWLRINWCSPIGTQKNNWEEGNAENSQEIGLNKGKADASVEMGEGKLFN